MKSGCYLLTLPDWAETKYIHGQRVQRCRSMLAPMWETAGNMHAYVACGLWNRHQVLLPSCLIRREKGNKTHIIMSQMATALNAFFSFKGNNWASVLDFFPLNCKSMSLGDMSEVIQGVSVLRLDHSELPVSQADVAWCLGKRIEPRPLAPQIICATFSTDRLMQTTDSHIIRSQILQ